MPAIKIHAADKWFSKCVRERSNWTCERCGTYYPEGKRMGLHCSHWKTRGNWGTRFSPQNAAAHCYGCHQHLGSHPEYFNTWMREHVGEGMMEIITEKASRPAYGIKKQLKDISAHYRKEYRRMLGLRVMGNAQYLEFESYD